MTATIAGAVMLGAMAGTASANTPSVPGSPSVQVVTGDEADAVAPLAQMVADLASKCVASDGLCSTATQTAVDAVDAASACLNAMASELGVSVGVTASMAAMNLDCAGIVQLMEGYARFALQQVNDCTAEHVSTCAMVYEAARLGIDRAAGCLQAVLPTDKLGIGGTDPGCASAIGMLYREAEGVIAVLTACLNGTDMACTLAADYAEFAINNLAGCTGDLFRFAANVETFAPGDTLDCYAVLDQINVAINGLLGQLRLPTQISPTGDEECSITVEIPIVAFDPTNPEASQQIESAHDTKAFVPSCHEPEAVQQQTDSETPPLATGLEGPECENATPREEHFLNKDSAVDVKKTLGHDVFVNYNGGPLQGEVSVSVDTTYHAKITAGGETQLKTWIGKIKAHIEAEAGISRTVQKTTTLKPNIPAKTEYHLARKLFAKVVEGRYYRKYSDCRVKWEYHRIRSPYYDGWFKWEEPYTGPKPT